MAEFVEEQKQILKFDPLPTNEKLLDFAINVIKREELISQQPNIGMFVPAVCENGVWRVLEEPINYKDWCIKATDKPYYLDLNIYERYQQAKAKVIFKGFEIIQNLKSTVRLKKRNAEISFFVKQNAFFYDNLINNTTYRIHTLEDLVKFNLEMI